MESLQDGFFYLACIFFFFLFFFFPLLLLKWAPARLASNPWAQAASSSYPKQLGQPAVAACRQLLNLIHVALICPPYAASIPQIIDLFHLVVEGFAKGQLVDI